jgi:protein-S-isoprenylcysteine O-methyltransferase Ste14
MNSEEKMLLEAFGEEYQDYKKQTWRIIPLIY